MSISDWVMIAGLMLNLFVTVGGFMKVMLAYENRFTKLETHMENLIAERRKEK